jgi:plasmid maintenance system killer protein
MQKVCTDKKLMIRTLGDQMARRLQSRLNELEAAVVLEDIRSLPQARAHELSGGRDEQISLDLVHPMRLVLSIGDEPVPRRADGGLDWSRTQTAIVEEITDTHE